MLTLEMISDKLQIEELLIHYCDAIDDNEIDHFDSIFDKNATIDYSNFGGPKGDVETIKAYLKKNSTQLPKQHLIGNVKIKVDGDQATSRCICFNPQGFSSEQEDCRMVFFGLWYEDSLVRTKAGWKIKHRVSKSSYNCSIG